MDIIRLLRVRIGARLEHEHQLDEKKLNYINWTSNLHSDRFISDNKKINSWGSTTKQIYTFSRKFGSSILCFFTVLPYKKGSTKIFKGIFLLIILSGVKLLREKPKQFFLTLFYFLTFFKDVFFSKTFTFFAKQNNFLRHRRLLHKPERPKPTYLI